MTRRQLLGRFLGIGAVAIVPSVALGQKDVRLPRVKPANGQEYAYIYGVATQDCREGDLLEVQLSGPARVNYR